MKKTLIEKPYTAEFGKIEVGDKVAFVTTGYGHNVNFDKGVYVGYIESGSEIYVKVLREFTSSVPFFPNGNEFNWSKDYNSTTWNDIRPTLVYKNVTKHAMTTLKLNRIAPLKHQ